MGVRLPKSRASASSFAVVSQTISPLSSPAETRRRPLGLNARLVMCRVWPCSVRVLFAEAGSLLGQVLGGKPAQLAVDERQQLGGRVRVGLLDGRQNASHFSHREQKGNGRLHHS